MELFCFFYICKGYDNNIDLPHPVLKSHYPMALYNRAAQFSPFSALTGLDDELAEPARIVDRKIEISEDRAADLDEKIQFLTENASEHPEIEAEYFVPDKLKEGGAYKTVKGFFKRVDDETHNVILMDGTVITAEGLFSINGNLFENQ